MKTSIKVLAGLTLLIFFTLGVTSCSDDDGYSLDKFWMSMATVAQKGDVKYFVLDDSTTLFPSASLTSYQPKNKRVIIDYTILSDNSQGFDHLIRLNGYVDDILTKNAIYVDPQDKVAQDSIGYTPIKVNSIWEGGGFLNINFEYNYAGEKPHMLNLVSAEPDLSVGKDVVKLEFRHNSNGDNQYWRGGGYVSFDLAPYIKTGKDIKFQISVKESDTQTKIYEINYKHKSTGSKVNSPVVYDKDKKTNLNIY